ncbi:hypothetical protein MRB53_005892 [Persea americana]|uniref:Uncharacterized protein n=1 Tax=Persea americana TaxID=3435 RepID=A0ACC2MFL6_PERAE|nr:hypothetical protein MRB53_005892 [Persea americana]
MKFQTVRFKTFVKGQGFDIIPDLLSQVLEIDSVEGAQFPIVNNRQINYNLIAKELISKHVAWIGGDIAHHKLSESYRLLNIFIHHNVSPKVNKRVTKEDRYLLYCIGTQRKVDLPLVVFRGMAKKIDRFTLEKSKSHIPSVELDDDDEGDRASPSGAAPSRVGASVAANSYA